MLLGISLARRQNRQLRSCPDRKKKGSLMRKSALRSLPSLGGVGDVVLVGTSASFTASEIQLRTFINGLDWRVSLPCSLKLASNRPAAL